MEAQGIHTYIHTYMHRFKMSHMGGNDVWKPKAYIHTHIHAYIHTYIHRFKMSHMGGDDVWKPKDISDALSWQPS